MHEKITYKGKTLEIKTSPELHSQFSESPHLWAYLIQQIRWNLERVVVDLNEIDKKKSEPWGRVPEVF